ncbi:MAG: hypothetical protein ABMA25_11515, partial [Ilumatobacteraceae bacterium]
MPDPAWPDGPYNTTRDAPGADTSTEHGSKHCASDTENVNDFVDAAGGGGDVVTGAGGCVVAVGGLVVPGVGAIVVTTTTGTEVGAGTVVDVDVDV